MNKDKGMAYTYCISLLLLLVLPAHFFWMPASLSAKLLETCSEIVVHTHHVPTTWIVQLELCGLL